MCDSACFWFDFVFLSIVVVEVFSVAYQSIYSAKTTFAKIVAAVAAVATTALLLCS